ncbi:MAG: pyridoxal phosphate-dependent aminotransferase [Gammaproteobacteria bacterium]
MKTSRRMDAVQPPVIPIVGQLVKDNPGTLSLAQGVVYFQPPKQALDKIAEFGNQASDHLYARVQGIQELINVIEKKLHKENGVNGDLSKRIIVTAGANMAFLNALYAITDPDNEIILPTPCYFNHEMAIHMVSCRPILVKTGEDFQIDVKQLRAAITPKTRAIVTVSPNNPTGVVYSEETLRSINNICREHNIYHICDEAYEYFTFDRAHHFSTASIIESQNHTISLYSLSKAYGFASWRIGYMLVPEKLFMPIMKAQDTNLICASVISQNAAIGVMQLGSNYCLEKLTEIKESRLLIIKELETIKNFCTFPVPMGAFYFFLKVETSLDSMTLVKKLIEKYKVAVLPGDAFGMKQGCYLRVSFGALQSETVIDGIRRLTKGLTEICHKIKN